MEDLAPALKSWTVPWWGDLYSTRFPDLRCLWHCGPPPTSRSLSKRIRAAITRQRWRFGTFSREFCLCRFEHSEPIRIFRTLWRERFCLFESVKGI